MEARILQFRVLWLTKLATALAASLLLLAAASACQTLAEQPASPVAIASPTAIPAPPPAQGAPAPEASLPPITSAASSGTQPHTGNAALALKPSLSPTEPASVLAVASHIAPPPPSDLVALAKRFRPGQDARLADPPALGPADVGHQEDFWIIDLSRQRVDEVSATLQIVTPHALWYTVGQLNARGRNWKRWQRSLRAMCSRR